MKISTILDHIDSGHMALPEFQRGYVWNRDQVRSLFDSLYRRHPVGGLLVWATESRTATHRGEGPIAAGVVKLLLDGQQRMTSLYGVVRGRPPKFFDGSAQAFTGLRFHLDTETFAFYQPVKMKDDPLWIDVTELMQKGNAGLGGFVSRLSSDPVLAPKVGEYVGRLSKLLGITDVELHVEEVTGADKTLDIVVDIFNRVNSGGTKLSKGDLALAKICSDWPEARDTMKAKLKEWTDAGYHFNLDWLLRSVNTALTGEAKFQFLHDKSADEIQEGLKRATKHLDHCLNMIGGRLGLDHDQVLFGRFAIPVMVRYLDQRSGPMNEQERDKLLFWFVQAGMWGRFTAQLIDAVKGVHLWADRYDREVKDVFAVQSEITEQVVKAMAVTLKASEHDRLFQKYVANIDAYDAFLRARALVDEPSRENIETGARLFRRAIELDPNFAGGYAGLAFNYSVKARFHYGASPQDDARKSLELARQAIAADRNFAWSYIALASAQLANGNHDAALDAVRQALVLQPNDYETILFMGYYLNFAGQSAKAIAYLERANSLSRIDTVRGLGFLAMAYFSAGRYADCERIQLRRFDKFGSPRQPVGYVFLAAAQASLDETDKAAATVARFRRQQPSFRMSGWTWINNYKRPEDRKRLYDAAVNAGIPECTMRNLLWGIGEGQGGTNGSGDGVARGFVRVEPEGQAR